MSDQLHTLIAPFPLEEDDQTVPDIENTLKSFAAEFDAQFARLLVPRGPVPPSLWEAVRYAALAPGKRVRPFLVVRCCELAGGSRGDAWVAAAALECMHAFSLIHDDLPALDDDDLRRGQPTCHRQFGEAMAILAGDALAVLPFELIARHVTDATVAAALVRELAMGAGWEGMIGGQSADVLEEGKAPSLETVRFIHERKTAALFAAACRMGAWCGGASPAALESIGSFGHRLGLAFQIVDDLLDVSSSTATLGKKTGKDAASGKQTYPRCVGLKESRAAASAAQQSAMGELEAFGPAADDLRALADYVVRRLH